MNIKDLGNYQMITDNTDSPILIGTPQPYTFSWSTTLAYQTATEFPNAEDQVSMLDQALAFVQLDIIDGVYGEYDPGCGVWWYLKGYDIEFVPRISDGNSLGQYWIYKIHVFRVEDRNIPATSPSNV
jgi:hypothetical protein